MGPNKINIKEEDKKKSKERKMLDAGPMLS